MDEREQLEQGITALEAQRNTLGDAVVDSMIKAAREKLSLLKKAKKSANAARKGDRRLHLNPNELQGERRQVTVVIVDVKGSTTILEQIGTEAWVKLMNRTFQILETEIYRFGGEVDQFRGDGLVAFFGATTTHEDDPERAVLASLAMQRSIKRFATELHKHQDIDLQLRIGINTGQVIVTNIGDEAQHNEDTAMGEAITLAARMETAAEPGTILATDHTYRLTQSQFTWESLGKVQVRGLSVPLAVYKPLTSKMPTSKMRGIAGLKSPMIGRETEFEAVCQAIARLRNGAGGIVNIVGEAGLGKSRLVAEAHDAEVKARPADTRPRWVEGRCRSYGGSMAYLLWLDVLRALLSVKLDDSAQHVLNKLRQQVQRIKQFDHPYPERIGKIYPYLGHLMSLPLETDAEASMDDLEGERLKRGTFRAIETLIEGMARQRPLVIVCEDLHWADPTSLELLERLLKLTDRVPLLFVCVLRPEIEHGGQLVKRITAQQTSQNRTNLWLVPLSSAETEALIENLLQAGEIPPQLKARILNHAEGNPFYVEEIIRSLMDRGVVVQEAQTGQWKVTDEVVNITLPPTLYGILMARIDRLPEAARRVLQIASVIGRIFRYRILQRVTENTRHLDRILGLLQREDLIRPRAGTPEVEYIFKHHFIQEVAYNSMLKHEQQTFHRRVARALEQTFPEQTEEQIGLLAHHWDQAEQPHKAIAYSVRAGAQAAAQFANAEAVNYYSRALTLITENTVQRYKILLAREKLYDLLGARARQAQDLKTLEVLAETLNSPKRQAEVALRRAHYAEAIEDYDTEIASAQTAISLARVARDTNSEAAGYLMWGRALFYQGAHRAAQGRLYQALTLCQGLPKVEADTLRSLGMVAFDLDEARDYQDQALHIYRKIGDRRGEWAALHNLSEVALYQGNYTGAREYCERALLICREIGDRQGESIVLQMLGYIFMDQGDYERARFYYEQVLSVTHKTENYTRQGRVFVSLSLIAHYLEENVKSATCAQKALQLSEILHDVYLQNSALIALGHALVGLGKYNEASAAYHQALALDCDHEPSHLTMESIVGLTHIALGREDWSQAKEHVEEILHCLEILDIANVNDPATMYLTCIQVLETYHDPRVRGLLTDAYMLLQERAAQIRNREARQAYLEKGPAHREIIQRYRDMKRR